MLTKKIVKYIQSLSHKKFRDEEGAFVAEGPKVVDELLSSKKFTCDIVCAEKEWLLQNEILLKNVPAENVFVADEHWLQRISLLKTPNKVVAVFKQGIPSLEPVLTDKVSLMLDDIQDPGNMGTLIRIADWFGIDNIICSENCVECYNPKVVQATMGSLSRVTVSYTSLISVIQSNKNISVYAAALDGVSLFDFPEMREGIVLIGNESHGISEPLLNMAEKKITIPRIGHAESLNAAVAAGIILSHIKRV